MDIEDRKKRIADRIKTERVKKFRSQEKFGEALKKELDPDSEGTIAQNTISNWENGGSMPDMDKFLAMAKIFGCDVGYLLCDYDEPIHGTIDICKATGLAEHTVKHLCRNQSWFPGLSYDIRDVIDALIYDYEYANAHEQHQPIIQLLYWFFHYEKKEHTGKAISIGNKLIDKLDDGYISEVINLDNIMEGAVLVEVQRALIALKQILPKDSE